MNTTARNSFAAGSIARIFASPVGPRILLDRPDEGGLIETFEAHHNEVKGLIEKNGKDLTTLATKQEKGSKEVDARLREIEQKVARRPGPGNGGPTVETVGHQVVNSDGFKAFAADRGRSKATIEVKTITTASNGALVPPDVRTDIVAVPRRRLKIRDLIAPGTTGSNAVWYPQVTSETNNASTVAENPSAPKPQSDFITAMQQANVRTIAHFFLISKQMFDDAPSLESFIDYELRIGLADAEERQLLFGDGSGTNLLGIMPQATAYAVPAGIILPSVVTQLDKLLVAFAQAELALLPATGVVLHPVDYANICLLKDTTNNYIGGGPFQALAQTFWDVPKVVTPVMTQNTFLVGAFRDGAQIFDRQQTTVEFSTEDRDNFVRNMVTALGEERLALAVKRPQAFIRGTF